MFHPQRNWKTLYKALNSCWRITWVSSSKELKVNEGIGNPSAVRRFHPQRNWKCSEVTKYQGAETSGFHPQRNWKFIFSLGTPSMHLLEFHPQRNWKSLTPTVSDWIIWVSSSKELKEVCSHFRVPNAYQCFILKGIGSLCHASCLSERVCSCFILKGIESIDWLPPRPGTVDPKSYYEK